MLGPAKVSFLSSFSKIIYKNHFYIITIVISGIQIIIGLVFAILGPGIFYRIFGSLSIISGGILLFIVVNKGLKVYLIYLIVQVAKIIAGVVVIIGIFSAINASHDLQQQKNTNNDVYNSQTYDLFRASSTVWLIIMGIICILEFLLTIVIYFIYKREKKLSHNIETETTAHNVPNIQNVASTNPFDQN